MSHPQGYPIGAASFGQTKTLFLQAPGRTGVLITTAKRRSQKAMRFKDAHAALDWCESHGALLLYFPKPNLSAN
jgi:hypothetical protein